MYLHASVHCRNRSYPFFWLTSEVCNCCDRIYIYRIYRIYIYLYIYIYIYIESIYIHQGFHSNHALRIYILDVWGNIKAQRNICVVYLVHARVNHQHRQHVHAVCPFQGFLQGPSGNELGGPKSLNTGTACVWRTLATTMSAMCAWMLLECLTPEPHWNAQPYLPVTLEINSWEVVQANKSPRGGNLLVRFSLWASI